MSNPNPPIDWKRVGLDLIQVAAGVALIFLGMHGPDFGDGVTVGAGAAILGSGARGLTSA